MLLLQSHIASHTQPTAVKSSKQKSPSIERPKLKQDINEEEWDTFTQEWKRLKRSTDIPFGQEADKLFDCCENSLGCLILGENSESGTPASPKKNGIHQMATSIRRTKLLTLSKTIVNQLERSLLVISV